MFILAKPHNRVYYLFDQVIDCLALEYFIKTSEKKLFLNFNFCGTILAEILSVKAESSFKQHAAD